MRYLMFSLLKIWYVQVYVTFVNNIVFNHSKMIIELKDFASFFEQFWEKKKKKICFVFLNFFL